MARAGTPSKNARLRWALAVVMTVSLILSLLPGIPLGAEEAYAGDNAELTVGASIRYDTYETHHLFVDGTVAYCAEPNKATPPAGTYTKQACTTHPSPYNGAIHEVQEIYAILYFGYGGPGFDPAMWPAYYNGGAWTPDLYQAMTHVFLSDVFAYNADAALFGCSSGFKSWAWKNIIGWDQENQQSVYSSWGWKVFERRWEVPQEFCDSCFQLTTGTNTQVIVSFVPGGWLELEKASANPSISEENSCYSLKGAVYGVFRDAACTDQVATLDLGEGTSARSGYLMPGTYHVKETKAPTGFALDGTVYDAVVRSGAVTAVNGGRVTDEPQYGAPEMLVAKLDSETGGSEPQGGASLADAQFKVRYYAGYYESAAAAEKSGSPTRTWVVRTDSTGKARLDDAYRVTPSDGTPNQELYHASDGSAVIPLGTVLIQEVKAPQGYHLSDTSVQVRQLKASGITPTAVTYNAPTVADQVFRGDLKLVKARESDQSRLAGIPFRIKDNTTGESHVIVTDANGQAGTQSDWNAHSQKTNANDAAVRADGTVDESKLDATAGCWFGGSTADNAKGALPYGSYSIEELPVAANAGLMLIHIPHVTVDEREGHIIDLGTLVDQPLSQVALLTFAREQKSGGKTAAADPMTTIIDRVQHFNLDTAAGIAYELHASLVDAADGSAITDADGDPICGSARFVPTQPNDYAEVAITLDTRDLAGRDITVYEELVRTDTGAVVAEHKDAADYNQMIHVNGQLLKTTATDAADGDKEVSADPEASLNDHVAYKGLVPGDEYTMEGTLWVKAEDGTADPFCDAAGDQYHASLPFVPEYADGAVDMAFTCDTSALADREIVVFEVLCKDGETIATHEDAADVAQTVTVRTPLIATVVADVLDNDSTVSADRGSTVVDTVDYSGLIPQKEYRIAGTLMAKSYQATAEGGTQVEVEPLMDADGAEVTGETIFTPERSEGQTSVTFAFDSSLLDGRDIVVYESLYRDDTLVAEDADPESISQSFGIHATSVWTEIGGPALSDKQVHADSEAAVTDSVRYADAVPGGEYTAYGLLADPETGRPTLQYTDAPSADDARDAEQLMRELLAAAGHGCDSEDPSLPALIASAPEYPTPFDEDAFKAILDSYPDIAKRLVTATCTFTAEGTSGAADLVYKLDARNMEGAQATSLVLLVKDGEAVGAEADLGSKEQTVTFVIGSIATTASDATDGDKALLNSASARIRDEVAYEGLIAGKEYVLEGTLYDRATGEPLLVADKEVSASTSFVAAAANGIAQVEFTFDASALVGRKVVVYEYLYRSMEAGDDQAEKVLVTQHADLDSAEQTVEIAGEKTGLPGTGYDKTGDTGLPIVLLVICGLAAAAAAGIYGMRQLRIRSREAERCIAHALKRI